MSISLLILIILSLIGIVIYSARLRQSVTEAPQLHREIEDGNHRQPSLLPSVAVIIPAYNEAENIRDCAIAVLNSTQMPESQLTVWIIDDQSTDDTLAIAHSLQQQLGDSRLKVIAGANRPADQIWAGKNWACTQAAQLAKGEFLLFIDADVQLKPEAIETALQAAQQEQIDLLTCWPQVICSCFSEWLVQPLIVNVLAIGFDFPSVNDPKAESAFAAGPFMLFRRVAYEKIGGHQAVASQIVEDVELARLVKSFGLKLRYVLGSELAEVRMYRSWGALWEGWTKNWYIGSNRDLQLTLYMAAAILLVCTFPWLGLGILIVKGLVISLNLVDVSAIALALIAIFLQYDLRRLGERICHIPTRYWWLTGVGGVLVAAIVIASIIKTETGWGWTWRGRNLYQFDK